MSARAVKRLLAQQQRKVGPEQVVEEDVEESSEEEPAGAVKNPFDLLGDEVCDSTACHVLPIPNFTIAA